MRTSTIPLIHIDFSMKDRRHQTHHQEIVIDDSRPHPYSFSEYGLKRGWEDQSHSFQSYSQNHSGEPTVLKDSLRVSPNTVSTDIIGQAHGPDSKKLPKPCGTGKTCIQTPGMQQVPAAHEQRTVAVVAVAAVGYSYKSIGGGSSSFSSSSRRAALVVTNIIVVIVTAAEKEW